MADSTVFKDVMRELERDKSKAARLTREKLNELYAKIPRIKEIDDALAKFGSELSMLILQQKSDPAKVIADMQETEEALLYERGKLLKKHRITDKFFNNAFRCHTCKDEGFVGTERCTCLKQRLINKHYEMSNLSKVLNRENFDSFNAEFYSNEPDDRYGISPRAQIERNAKECKDFINVFKKSGTDQNPMNLLFYGKPGLGKTFLCNCVAKELLDGGFSVIYLTAPQLFKMVENLRFGKSEEKTADDALMEAVYTVDLLIIDDLGSEFSTAVTASEFFNIINTRLLNQKQMLFSTNIATQDLIEHYSDRVSSRIIGNFTMLLFIGEDIRVYKKYNSLT